MSDVTVLSYEYKTASEFARPMNEALITLKKVALQLPGNESLEHDAVQQSAERLAQNVELLAGLLDGTPVDSRDSVRVPRSLVARLRRERGDDLPSYVAELRRLAGCLRRQPREMNDAQLLLLDQLAAEAHGEAAKVFRRLVRS